MTAAPPNAPGKRIKLTWLLGAMLAASGAVNAHAFWAYTDGGNYAGATADALQQGSTPVVAATGPSSVDIDFLRATTSSGREVTSYLINRYSSSIGIIPSASFTCSWAASTTLSCSETGVPDGTWYYTDAAHISGTLWTGIESSKSNAVTIDTVAPAAPSSPDLAAASDTGTFSADNLTSNVTPTFEGTAESGSTVKIFDGATEVGSGVATGGNYSVGVSTLSEGAHTITATATDPAGNGSSVSPALAVTIDSVAPAVPSTPDLATVSDTGSSSSDNVTSIVTPTFTGSAEAGSTVTVLSDATVVGTVVATGVYGVVASALSQGTQAMTATATDVAGNVSSASPTLTVTIDSVAPAAPSTPDLATASDTGNSSSDNVTSTVAPTFVGTAESGSTVKIFDGVIELGSGPGAGGDYSILVSALSQGAHTITATATDTAGNLSSASTGLTVTVDSIAPASPVPAPDLASGSDTGSSNSDNITSVTTPTFTSTGVASAEAGSTVTILSDGNAVGTGTVTGTGTYSVMVSAIAEGAHTITARATDAAGNASSQSAGLTVTVDLTAPLVTTAVIAKQSGYLAGSIKQAGSYYVYANVTETGGGISTETANVSAITTGGTATALTAGSYSSNGLPYTYRSALLAAISPLTAGSQTFSIVSTDRAGNSRSQSVLNVLVDNSAPTASNIQTINLAGGAGRASAGDQIIFTFSEQIDPESILSGWTGSSTNVVVLLTDGGCLALGLGCGDDSFTIRNASNTLPLPFGTVNLNRHDYHGGGLIGTATALSFGASGTPSTMIQAGSVITITLGTGSGTADTAGGSGGMQWGSAAVTLYDAAGNGLANAGASEGGASDVDF